MFIGVRNLSQNLSQACDKFSYGVACHNLGFDRDMTLI